MRQYCIILTTINNLQIAQKITSTLLELNLAGCVQIDNVKSYFKWEGNIVSEDEHRILIKANSDNYQKIEEVIVKIHNYEVPQIIKIDIDDGLKIYLDWIDSEGKRL
ncbi:divalent-cation tolerance protein CutA [Rickettsia endosymbiont of Halotydeus destructor]|uniref:divalent-cation tolerance protein CutA n=1 Tax=Rickettsia endosymbiont of Halotydeus destructor TaxID=2996754 RepID=UPI003BAE5074